jgi:VanZ family protein
MVDWVMRVLGLDHSSAETLIVVGRKITHFCFYGFVALIGMRLALKNGAATKFAIFSGLFAALAFATFDESRQSTEPDRGGSAWDVALDMSGAATTLAVACAIARREKAIGPNTLSNSSKL